MLGVSAINSQILSQVPWKPRGILNPSSLPIGTTIRPFAYTLSLQATHAHMISLAVAQTHFFLTKLMVVPHAQQVLRVCHESFDMPNLASSGHPFPVPVAHLLQLLEILPAPYKKKDNSRIVRSLGVSAQRLLQSTYPF